MRQRSPHNNVRFVIAGVGPDHQLLVNLAKARQVEDAIVFTGQVGDTVPFYSMADVVAIPSHTEGSPNVLLEAMAAGVPVVATEVGGVPEIVENDNQALLVEKKNPRSE